MARASKSDVTDRAPAVASLIVDDTSVYLTDADLIVDEIAEADPNMGASRLQAIAAWVAAHLAVKGEGERPQSASQGRVQWSRSEKDTKLPSYADNAIALDTSGRLSGLLTGKVKPRVRMIAVDSVPETTRLDSTLE